MRLFHRFSFRHLGRQPITWWLAVIGVAAVTSGVVYTSTATALRSASRYGGLSTVAVFTRAIAPGESVGDADVRTESRPRHFLPHAQTVLSPSGRTVRVPVVAGDVATETNLGSASLHGVAGALSSDERAIAVPVEKGTLRVHAGDYVDVIASSEQRADDVAATPPAVVVARSARVVDVDDDAMTVVVPSVVAPNLAYAVAQLHVTLALTPVMRTDSEPAQ